MAVDLKDILALFPLSGAGYLFNAVPILHWIKRKSKLNDAETDAYAKFVYEHTLQELEATYNAGGTLPSIVAKFSTERETQKIESFSAKLGIALIESDIRQQAQHEVKIAILQQLMQQTFLAFQEEQYEIVLDFSRLLQPLLMDTAESYATLDEMYILSLIRLARVEKSIEKRKNLYASASERVAAYQDNFFIIFEHGHTSLLMTVGILPQEQHQFIQTAIQCFQQAAKLDSQSDIALNNLAVSLRYSLPFIEDQAEQIAIIKKAITLLEEAKEISPDNNKVYSNLGESYAQLAALSPHSSEQHYQYRVLAWQAFEKAISLQVTFSSLLDYANALRELAKIEQDSNKKDELLQQAVRAYNDAQNIAPSRGEAGFACLRIVDVHDYARRFLQLDQNTKDRLVFQIFAQLRLAVEFFPFDAATQFKTAMLIFYIAKYGDQQIPLLKRELKPLVSSRNKNTKYAFRAEMLLSNARYVRDAIALNSDSPAKVTRLVEANIYWGLLQKKIGETQEMQKEYARILPILDKAERLKLYSTSYMRACMFAVQGDKAGCQHKLKEAVDNGLCPPRQNLKTEPYFEAYHQQQWFKDILAALPEQTTPHDYFCLASLEAGVTP